MGQCESRSEDWAVAISKPDEKKGESAIYRNIRCAEKLLDEIPGYEGVHTVQKLHEVAFEKYKDVPFVGTRTYNPDGTRGEYEWVTYGELKKKADRAGYALLNGNFAVENKDKHRFAGVWAKNREEWIVLDVAGTAFGVVLLPMYDTLGAEGIEFVFEKTGVETFFVGGDKVDLLIASKEKGKSICLKNVISLDKITDQQVAAAKKVGIQLLDWQGFNAFGEKKVERPKIEKDTLYTLCFTSGTTGLPKGAMLSHNNMISVLGGFTNHPDIAQWVEKEEVFLSFLPMSHIYERSVINLIIARGLRTGFYSGDPLKIPEDLKVVRPTVLTAVPRLFNKFFEQIKAGISKLEGFKKSLADHAVETKLANYQKTGNDYTHALYDRLVFAKAKEALGGRVKLVISSAAPLAKDVGDFLKVAFCCPVLEAYGSTELCGAGFGQVSTMVPGNVGMILTACELKLQDVPEMNYTHKDTTEDGQTAPRGEICVRGPSVFKGYYKDDEKTKEAIDSEGWLHTGDIGVFLPGGMLKIVDRKKNIFKLSQGEYVAPDKIENGYLTSKYIAEVFVYGDSLQNNTVAIAVPNKPAIMDLGKELKIDGTFEQLCANTQIRKKVLEDMNNCGKKAGLKGFEMAINLYIEPVSFVLTGLTTPTLKLKREPARKHYEAVLKGLYDKKLE